MRSRTLNPTNGKKASECGFDRNLLTNKKVNNRNTIHNDYMINLLTKVKNRNAVFAATCFGR